MRIQNVSLSSQTQGLVFWYCYRTVLKAIDERYDVRGSTLAELVRSCLENRGRPSPSQRAYYNRHMQQEALAFLECFTERLLFGPDGRLSLHEYRYLVKLSSNSDEA